MKKILNFVKNNIFLILAAYWLISPSIFFDMVQYIRNEEQVGVLEYNATDEEMSEYWN